MSAPVPSPPTSAAIPQEFSHLPAIPPPVKVELLVLPEHECTYLPAREARFRAVQAGRIDPELYHDFMDAGFRRSGRMLYQPICRRCRRCVQIRVPVATFAMSKSQRRVWRRNQDLLVTVGRAVPSQEKFLLYRRYLLHRHDGKQDDSPAAFESFLYDSPTRTIEFEYRLRTGKLIAAGICDIARRSLSSVYFFFDPAESRRSPGIFGVLQEIDFARQQAIPYVYLGYWVEGAQTMDYKAQFRPLQLLGGDGAWRDR